MSSPVQLLTIVQYYRERPGWDAHHTRRPAWSAVERSITQMDNFCFPIVLVSVDPAIDDGFDDDDALNIIGGDGRFSLFQATGDWRYENPTGSREPVRLWDSDQGHFCEQRNIADLELALHIARRFYDTGSFAECSP